MYGNTFLLHMLDLSIETGCPGRLWSLPPWSYAEAVWTWFWTAGSRFCEYVQ